jgi:hypothetical protein
MKTAKRRKSNLEKRLAKEKNTVHRSEIDGGCILLDYRYWKLLAEKRKEEAPQPELTPQDWFNQLVYVSRKSRFSDGWAAHQFKAKFGEFPPWDWSPEPQQPCEEVSAWVKERREEYLATKKASESEKPEEPDQANSA